jgi:uncharacterized integral membrane protein
VSKEAQVSRASNLLAWGAVVLVAVLAMLNWSTLMAPAPLNLLLIQIEAPLGVVMLGLAGVLVALFLVAGMRNRIGTLLETRRLSTELQHAHELADKAEASRIENLHHLISTEFRLLNERLDHWSAAAPREGEKEFRPLSLTEIATRHERS